MLLLQFQIGRVDEDATAVKMLTSQLFKREMDQQIISDGRDILGYVCIHAWPANKENGEWDLCCLCLCSF
jgi:hypothetical protein